MSYIGSKEFLLEVAKGTVAGHKAVNKFGSSLNIDSGVDTDIWDGANATTDQDVWVAPTTARTHDITSTSTNDTSAGSGAQTVRIYGLTGWGAAEVTEDITMNGTSNVATANSYVIIYRMFVLTSGGTTINAGNITATAQTDATLTAMILAGYGQTQMAIYGVPSTQTFYITRFFGHIEKGSPAGTEVQFQFLINQEPDSQLTQFRITREASLTVTGTSAIEESATPPIAIPGPAIVKIRGNADTNNTFGTAGFDGVLVDN